MSGTPERIELVSRRYRNGVPVVFRAPPEDARCEPTMVLAADGARSTGLFWTPASDPRPRTGVLLMHPHVDFTRHYAIPRLIAAGYGCLGATTRSPNNDVALVHEQAILDVAAHMRFLRDRGAERVVLLGNSGGGSLFALYQREAKLPPGERLARTPGGRPLRLDRTEMPPGDAIVFLAAHKGQGNVMAEVIDPSVVDEADPFSVEPSLDLYDARNGFATPPVWSRYDEAFLDRYRAAQRERIRRLDAVARAFIAENHRFEALRADPDFAAWPEERRRDVFRRATIQRVMTVYRTMANPRYVDRDLDPSPREYGSLLSPRPDIMNFGFPGFARVTTPHAWLSTWSALSTNADVLRTAPGIDEPALVVMAEADTEVYVQGDGRRIHDALASRDKTFAVIEGARHYFEPEVGQDEAPAMTRALDVVVAWLGERFGP